MYYTVTTETYIRQPEAALSTVLLLLHKTGSSGLKTLDLMLNNIITQKTTRSSSTTLTYYSENFR